MTSTARVRRWRELRRAGKREVRTDVEILPGIRIKLVEIDEAIAEDMLIGAKVLRDFDADVPDYVDEGVRLALAELAERFIPVSSRPDETR
ncbi:MAG: hypothetical protein JNK47_20255 [Mesorhizobium sp.]|nr:hypothetical protein [Mesorhizobium sp.]MBL8579544.1 hypothetical protein [Mesorhizobium sp.]